MGKSQFDLPVLSLDHTVDVCEALIEINVGAHVVDGIWSSRVLTVGVENYVVCWRVFRVARLE